MGKRRALGEGSLYRRADGKWVAAVWDPAQGKQVRKYRKTQEAALEVLDEMRGRVRNGQPPKDARITFGRALDEWLEVGLESAPLKASTKDLYRNAARMWVRPYLGNVKLPDLRRSTIERALLNMRDDGLSGATRQTSLTVIRHVCKYSLSNRWTTINPTDGIPKPSADPVRVKRIPTPEESLAIFEKASASLRITAAVCAYTGCRVGEALALTWQAVDLEGATIEIRATTYRPRGGGHGIELTEPKTDRSKRAIPIPAGLVAELKAWKATLPVVPITGPVIASSVGTPRDYSNLANELRAICKELGLEGVTFHTWRHSAATVMMEAGVPDRVIADLLGQDIRTTRRIYQHTRDPIARAATNVIGDGFSQSGLQSGLHATGSSSNS